MAPFDQKLRMKKKNFDKKNLRNICLPEPGSLCATVLTDPLIIGSTKSMLHSEMTTKLTLCVRSKQYRQSL